MDVSLERRDRRKENQERERRETNGIGENEYHTSWVHCGRNEFDI